MIIVILDAVRPLIEVTFTDEELLNPLFQKAMDNFDTDITNSSFIIGNIMQVIGRTVDEIREIFCGDVIHSFDEDGNPIDKDLTNCPQFKIGEMDIIEIDEELDIIEEGNGNPIIEEITETEVK